jgi:hypothetical protein
MNASNKTVDSTHFSGSSVSSSEQSVTFGCISIREFERIVGDHPDVSDLGPPLAIGWGYCENDDVTVDDYECQRDGQRCKLEPLEGTVRRNILQYGFQVAKEDINDSIREVYRAQKQRHKRRKKRGVLDRLGKVFMLKRS